MRNKLPEITEEMTKKYPTVREINNYLRDREHYTVCFNASDARRLKRDSGLKHIATGRYKRCRVYVFFVIRQIKLPW